MHASACGSTRGTAELILIKSGRKVGPHRLTFLRFVINECVLARLPREERKERGRGRGEKREKRTYVCTVIFRHHGPSEFMIAMRLILCNGVP